LIKDSVPEYRFVEVMEKKKKRKIIEQNRSESSYLSSNVIHQAEKYNYNYNDTMENNVNKFTKTLLITKELINEIYNNIIILKNNLIHNCGIVSERAELLLRNSIMFTPK